MCANIGCEYEEFDGECNNRYGECPMMLDDYDNETIDKFIEINESIKRNEITVKSGREMVTQIKRRLQ